MYMIQDLIYKKCQLFKIKYYYLSITCEFYKK